MMKYLENELENNLLEDFIKKFVDEIIVSKKNKDRYKIHLDIYLNLNDLEKDKKKGANHINGPFEHEILYMSNKSCETIENKRKDYPQNHYTYNVYIETL